MHCNRIETNHYDIYFFAFATHWNNAVDALGGGKCANDRLDCVTRSKSDIGCQGLCLVCEREWQLTVTHLLDGHLRLRLVSHANVQLDDAEKALALKRNLHYPILISTNITWTLRDLVVAQLGQNALGGIEMAMSKTPLTFAVTR